MSNTCPAYSAIRSESHGPSARGRCAKLPIVRASLAALIAFSALSQAPAAAAVEGQKPRLQIDLGVHSAPARRLSLAPSNNLLVTASDDKTARVWDLATGQLRHVLRAGAGAGEIGRLYGAAIHPGEDFVAIAGSTGSATIPHRILMFSLATGRFLKAIDAKGGDIKHLVWSADGTSLFAVYAGENAVRAFDASGNTLFERRFSAPAYGLAASAGGRVAATALDGTVVVMEARGGRVSELRTLRTREGEAVGAAFSPDGSRLLVGSLKQLAAPELFDLQRGVSLGPLRVPGIRVGNFMSVAWSADGKTLVAAGSARDHEHRHDAFFFNADGRLIGRQPLAGDTILDLKSLSGDRFAFSSFDGSWGVVTVGGVSMRVDASISGVRGPERLLLSADARQVQWPLDSGGKNAVFNFTTRQVTFEPPSAGLRPPVVTSGWTDKPEWQDTRTPKVRGHAIPLGADETSRSVAFFGDRRTALLGTTQRLIRLDENGRIRWDVRAPGEVWAVNLSADGRMAVTATSDGTVRWWRAADGALLLSLLVTRDGRWVTWAESGYFDASAGADRLAGWAVNREDAPTADFFSLSRFREQFNRPELVDNVFRSLEPVSAATTLAFPPVLESADRALPGGDLSRLAIPYLVRPGSGGGVEVEIRVDGRPASEAKIVQKSTAGGQISGEVVMPAPPVDSLVQLVARNSHGVSEPLGFTLVQAAAPPAPAPILALQPAPQPVWQGDEPQAARSQAAGSQNAGFQSSTLQTAGSQTAGSQSTGSQSTASQSTGSQSTGSQSTGSQMVGMQTGGAQAFASQTLGSETIRPQAIAPQAITPQAIAPQAIAPQALPLQVAAAAPGTTLLLKPLSPFALPATATVSLQAPGPAAAAGRMSAAGTKSRLLVLAVGISEYRKAEYRLGLAAKDARDFSSAMERQAGRLYSEVLVKTLTDGGATRQTVIQQLHWLSANVGPTDVGVLFFAGHGLNSKDGQYYFLTHDADHERLVQTGVPEEEIRKALGRIRGKAVLFVDTCFGGSALSRAGSSEIARMANNLSASENGVIVFASSSGRQLSEENDAWGNGAFTKAVLAGLSGEADLTRTGRITFKGLDFYVSEEVRKLTEGRQTPVTISPTGVPDFPLAQLSTS